MESKSALETAKTIYAKKKFSEHFLPQTEQKSKIDQNA